jgi:hypothetical protein
MDIQVFGYKFRVEILILIVIIWWILFGHTLCGCSNVGLIEGFHMAKHHIKKVLK